MGGPPYLAPLTALVELMNLKELNGDWGVEDWMGSGSSFEALTLQCSDPEATL